MRKLREGGVTLVEVLVVLVMIGILFTAMVPVYTGYVQNQRREAVENMAQTAAVAANAYLRRNNEPPPDSAALQLFLPVPGRFLISISGDNVIVRDGTDNSIESAVSFR